jgi:signal transduction histidine kinase/ActR/RegA family two-component response regulator
MERELAVMAGTLRKRSLDRALWHAVIDHLPMDVFVVGKDEVIVAQNDHNEALWGNLVGHKLQTAGFPSEMGLRWPSVLPRAFSGALVREECTYTRNEHQLHIYELLVPVKDAEGCINHVLVVQIDINERKAAEAAQRRIEIQLQQNQKLEAIGTLAGGIAHDFNNILAIIDCYLDLAMEHASPGTELAEDLENVKNASQRAQDLVRQILTFSRRHRPAPVPLDLGETIRESLRMIRASLPTTIGLDVSVPSGLPPVLGESISIHQILLNLCSNAAYAMRSGMGRILITLAPVSAEGALCERVRGLAPGKYLCLTVQDTGPGMEQETLAHIFEPFFTTKPAGEGTGLGLAVVQGIVRSMGGAIHAMSAPKRGLCIEIYFPPTPSGQDFMLESEQILPRGNGERILLVDDESLLLEAIAALIAKLGYRPSSHANSTEALRCFLGAPEDFALLLTDKTMPGLTGPMLIRRIRESRPDLPVLMMSGDAGFASEAEDPGIENVRFVPKPIHLMELARLLDELLQGRRAGAVLEKLTDSSSLVAAPGARHPECA